MALTASGSVRPSGWDLNSTTTNWDLNSTTMESCELVLHVQPEFAARLGLNTTEHHCSLNTTAAVRAAFKVRATAYSCTPYG